MERTVTDLIEAKKPEEFTNWSKRVNQHSPMMWTELLTRELILEGLNDRSHPWVNDVNPYISFAEIRYRALKDDPRKKWPRGYQYFKRRK